MSILQYFHGERFSRATLRILKKSWVIKWRVTDVILIAALAVIYRLVWLIKPFQRQFSVTDITISHPFAEHERVTTNQLFLYAGAVPAATIILVALLLTPPKHKVYHTYVAIIGLLVSLLVTSDLTDILKNYIGRLRPDFLSRCVPKADASRRVLVYAVDVCTTTNTDRLLDGFRTTPLGHSSLSFAGLLYTSLYLAGQLVAQDTLVGAWRTVLSAAPTLGASLIALSRTQDYRHHFVDVFIGGVLGSIIAIWSYLRIFPLINHEFSYVPKYLLELEEKPAVEEQYDSLGLESV